VVAIVKLAGRVCAALLGVLLPVLASTAVEAPTAAAYSRDGLPVEFLDVPSPLPWPLAEPTSAGSTAALPRR
jgi:hypothetical protein